MFFLKYVRKQIQLRKSTSRKISSLKVAYRNARYNICGENYNQISALSSYEHFGYF